MSLISKTLTFFVAISALYIKAEEPSVIKENVPDRSFIVRTAKLEAKFKDGLIVNLKNLQNGELICDETLNDLKIPRGLGCISGNIKSMCAMHIPWGSPQMNQDLKSEGNFPNLHFPFEKSSFKINTEATSAEATWTGLTDGINFFENESITIKAGIGKDGELVFSATGYSENAGIFGIQIPLVNIKKESTFFLPHFGGMKFDASSRKALHSFGGAPFYEAPAAAFETESGAVGIWREDKKFNPYYVYYNWSGKSFSFAFEHLNLIPFEQHKEISSPEWKLDVFSGGWVEAYTPFRTWYHNLFSKELAIRDSVKWANKTRVIIDMFDQTPEVMFKTASVFDPETVVFHSWNARAPKFDTELPDWTPRAGYIDFVKLAHSFGFRTMAYVNTYCINYNSPVFKRDNLKDIVLTRKSSIWQYKEDKKDKNTISELLIGTITSGGKDDQFEGVPDNKLLYGDPLSAKWRKYHVELMKWWNSTTGTDANYEDTAGCTGDFGNGTIDGLSAAQGSVAMMKDILDAQPQIPMASEYGPAPIGFAVKWPLNYVQVWGNHDFRKYRMHNQYPVCSYIYGNSPWIPVLRANNNFLIQLVSACSDSLGGMAQFYGYKSTLDAKSGMTGHLKRRAQIFAERQLTPFFQKDKYEKNLVCMYKDFENRIYKYYDDGFIQRMEGPDRKNLYERVSGISELKTELFIPGWPASDGNMIYGLNPSMIYALFPGTGAKTAIQLLPGSEKIFVEKYCEEKSFSLMLLESSDTKQKTAKIKLKLNANHKFLTVNGKKIEIPTEKVIETETTLPTAILYSDSGRRVQYGSALAKPDDISLKITGEEGLDAEEKVSIAKTLKNNDLYFFQPEAGGEKTADYLIYVPDKNSSVKLNVRNTSKQYGNGSIAKIYINGVLVHSLDCLKDKVWDTDLHEWIIPVGSMAGQNILISTASNCKNDGNSDMQWISIPVLIKDDIQKLSDKKIEAK